MITHRNGLGLGPGRGAWIPAPPANTVLPAISGVAQQGETLSCSNGSWTNLPTSFGYQWKRDGVAIGGATANSYLLQAADVGTTITCMVTAFNGGGSAQATSNPTSAVLPLAPSNTALPAITGTAQEGETLSCSTGSWTNSPTSYAYQWKRDGSNISGATSSTYGLVAADIGATITCAVVATNAGGSSAPAAATGVGPVLPAVPVNSSAPVASGTAEVGQTLSCTTGTWSNSPTSFAYQWRRDGSDISGATASSYLLAPADEDALIDCEVTASNAGGAGAPADSNDLGPITTSRIAPIDYTYGNRPTYWPQTYFDTIDAEARDANFHPNLGSYADVTVNAIADGPWSDPNTWDIGGGQIPHDISAPGLEPSVNINGFAIEYDVYRTEKIRSIHVNGQGEFSVKPDADTLLWVWSYINHGVEDIAAITRSPVFGRSRFHVVLWKHVDPGDTVLGCWMTMGPTRRYSTPKTELFELAASLPAATDELTISGLGAADWEPGDYILFPATEWSGTSATDPDYDGPNTFYTPVTGQVFQAKGFVGFDRGDGKLTTKDEVRQILTRVGDTITFDPLTYDHDYITATHGVTGVDFELKVAVANLSRNILIESEDPDDRLARGHVMHMHHSDRYIAGNEYRSLGRSDIHPGMKVPLPDTTVILDTNGGTDIADPTNIRGRYSGLHDHNCGAYFGRQGYILGNVAWPGPDPDLPPLPGWVFVSHSSNTIFERNIVYKARGSAFTWETGAEIGQAAHNLACWVRGDGFTAETYSVRAEEILNHNGHQGVAFDMQARQVLLQHNIASSVHYVMPYYQNRAGDQVLRVPDLRALRYPMPLMRSHQPTSNPLWETYGEEQTQLPPNIGNHGWGVRRVWTGSHRNAMDRTDATGGIFIHLDFHDVAERVFDNFNYSFHYVFKDCYWSAIAGGSGKEGAHLGNVTTDMSFSGVYIRNFDADFVDAGSTYNFDGYIIDTDSDNVALGGSYGGSYLTVTGNDPTVLAFYQVFPSFDAIIGSPTPGEMEVRFRDLISHASAGLPETADVPDPAKGGAPDPGLSDPRPYNTLTGTDLTTGASEFGSLRFSANIVDEIAPRWYPSGVTFSSIGSPGVIDTRPFQNTNQSGAELARTNGVFDAGGGTIKSRIRVPTFSRLTGEIFPIGDGAGNAYFDVTITGLTAPQIAEWSVVDPDDVGEGFDLSKIHMLEETPLNALSIPATPPTILNAAAYSIAEGLTLEVLLQGAREHLTWTIEGGADAAQFEIALVSYYPYLRWAGDGVQDFEAPADSGGNNVYDVIVRATDPFGNFTDLNVVVTVTNVNDTPLPFFHDSMTRANMALEDTQGGQWVKLNGAAGSLSIVSNLVDFLGTEASRVAYVSGLTGSNHMRVVTRNHQSGTGWWCAGSITDKDNWIGMQRVNSSTVRLDKCVAGAVTQMASYTCAYAVAEEMELLYVDGYAQVVVSGVVLGAPVQITSPPPATDVPGIIRNSGVALVDRFSRYIHEALPTTLAGAPLVVDGKRGHVSTDNTSFALGKVVVEANVQAMDLVVVFVAADGVGTQTPPVGWTILDQGTSNSAVTGALYYHEVLVNGVLPDLTITNSTSESMAYQSFCLRGDGVSTINLEAAAANFNGANTDLASFTPSGGTQDYLFIAALCLDNTLLATAPPANMAWLTINSGTNGSASASVATARMTVAGTSFDPGTFTHTTEQVRGILAAAWY